MTFCWNPSFTTSNRKRAAASALKLYIPASLLTLTCVSPVAGLVSVRLAPGTTAPVVSVTTP